MSTKVINNGNGELSCKCFKRCGGCQLDKKYSEQLEWKQQRVNRLLSPFGKVEQLIGMDNPYFYRNKVQTVFRYTPQKRLISGVYQSGSQSMVAVDDCIIEDKVANDIIKTIRDLMRPLKIMPYDFETQQGLLRHVLIRRAFATGQIMVCLVTSKPLFPAKRNFVNALREKHPNITTVVQNICDNTMPLTLGVRENVFYGNGYIEDILCGMRFNISSRSFYQVNPVQTEVLYNTAIDFVDLHGTEIVIDAYCGIGTIGMICSKKAGEVYGVEVNKAAVKDAVANAKLNKINNIKFFPADSGRFMEELVTENIHADVVMMDPPRAGADQCFLDSLIKLSPDKICYISCNPETLARDLKILKTAGYRATKIQPVDMFPHTTHVECVVLITRNI